MSLKRDIEKLTKKGYEILLGSQLKEDLTFCSSGSKLLDWALGGRGFPCGKMTEIFGKESSGKSLICLTTAAQVTKSGKYVIFCDTEGNYTNRDLNEWRERFGINMDLVLDIPPQTAEDMINITTTLVAEHKDQIGLIIVDSASALTTAAEMEKAAGESTVASTARLLEIWTRKLFISNRKTAVLFVSQLRDNIGAYGGAPKSKGGWALKHNAAVRVSVKGRAQHGKDTELNGPKGQEISVHVVKSKIGSPGRVAELFFDFGLMAFDVIDEVITLGKQTDAFEYSAPFYTLNGKKFKGREMFKEYLQQHPDELATIIESANTCIK